ncbi:MAG TPA: hypothetical protein VFU76_13730, partial [Terriglobales bacterium]|nr:hypothetical protein [Terriglobales bacterium]
EGLPKEDSRPQPDLDDVAIPEHSDETSFSQPLTGPTTLDSAPKTPPTSSVNPSANKGAPAASKGKASQRKIAANRRNSQLSTGPKTQQGKKFSSRNATKHGILARDAVIEYGPGRENVEDFERLEAALLEEWQPTSDAQRIRVQELADTMWRLRRVVRHEVGQVVSGTESMVSWKLGMQQRFSRKFRLRDYVRRAIVELRAGKVSPETLEFFKSELHVELFSSNVSQPVTPEERDRVLADLERELQAATVAVEEEDKQAVATAVKMGALPRPEDLDPYVRYERMLQLKRDSLIKELMQMQQKAVHSPQPTHTKQKKTA